MNRLSKPLNVISMIVGLVIGIAHVYLPIPSIGGLIMGIIMALSGTVSMGVNYYFTEKNSSRPIPPKQDTRRSTIFLFTAAPLLLFSVGSCFFGAYTGNLLLLKALNFAIPAEAAIAVSVILATLFTVSTLINSFLQLNMLWQGLKKEPQAESNPRQGLKKEPQAESNPRPRGRQKQRPEPCHRPSPRSNARLLAESREFLLMGQKYQRQKAPREIAEREARSHSCPPGARR